MEAYRERIKEMVGEKRSLDVGAVSLCHSAIWELTTNRPRLRRRSQLPTADPRCRDRRGGRDAKCEISQFESA